jgi:hypothetical protein
MYSRQVESADDVISHLEVEADDRLHDTMAQKFKDCLIRYLRGRGYVLHPTLMEAHRENDYLKRHEEERNVPQARVRRLLKQGSGSDGCVDGYLLEWKKQSLIEEGVVIENEDENRGEVVKPAVLA